MEQTTPRTRAEALTVTVPAVQDRTPFCYFPLLCSGSIGPFGDNPVQDRAGIPARAAGSEAIDHGSGLLRGVIVDAPHPAPAPALPLQNPRPPPRLPLGMV